MPQFSQRFVDIVKGNLNYEMVIDFAGKTSFVIAGAKPAWENLPSVAELESDLAYVKAGYSQHPAFARIDGKPVVFVYNAGDTSCEVADRWAQAANGEWYVVLKVFGGYRDCANQPDAWHQYGPL